MSLSKLYKDIAAKAAIPYSSAEIQDIRASVEHLLLALLSDDLNVDYNDFHGIKTTMTFKCSYLKPCGSMEENTSLWKSVKRSGRESKYIELDYLAVLSNRSNVVNIREGDCNGCRKIYNNNNALEFRRFGPAFLSALYAKIESMCSCQIEPERTTLTNEFLYRRGCLKCTYAKDTGYLQIAKVPDFSRKNVKHSEHCSLVFYWTSRTNSLLAPNIDTLELTEKINRLVVRVDILPAFEIVSYNDRDHSHLRNGHLNRFIVPKRCPKCIARKTFMISYCMHEWHAIHNSASEQHKLSYCMVKFLYGQFVYWTEIEEYLNNYHAKVAFLTHLQSCSNNDEHCTRCITEIFRSLITAYTSESLEMPQFHALKTFELRPPRARHYSDSHIIGARFCVESLLSVVSELSSHSEDKQSSSLYRPYHVIGFVLSDLSVVDGRGGYTW